MNNVSLVERGFLLMVVAGDLLSESRDAWISRGFCLFFLSHSLDFFLTDHYHG